MAIRRFPFAALMLGSALLAAAAADAQTAERRVALVIGNAAYAEAPLKNPVNDARAMAARLKALGFAVTSIENGTRDQMGRAIAAFTRGLGPDAAVLFYYAGHGIQSRGRNYLIPVDATLNSEGDLRYQAVDVGGLTEEMEQTQARVGFIVLDACRNNPFERRFRGSASRGLAAIDAARGLMVAYATAPGAVAADGEGQNGVYTAALLRALNEPGLKAEDVFKRVRIDVGERTQNQQTPWESSSLIGDFVFNRAAPPAAPAPMAAAPPAVAPLTADRDALFWSSIQSSRRAGDFEAYLAQFPQGTFAALARNRLDELRPAALPQAAPAQAALPQAAPPYAPPAARVAASPPPTPAPPRETLPAPPTAAPPAMAAGKRPTETASRSPDPPVPLPPDGTRWVGRVQCVQSQRYAEADTGATAVFNGGTLEMKFDRQIADARVSVNEEGIGLGVFSFNSQTQRWEFGGGGSHARIKATVSDNRVAIAPQGGGNLCSGSLTIAR